MKKLNKNLTPVTWLMKKLSFAGIKNLDLCDDIYIKAKQMEKQQIIDAHLIGLITSLEMQATKQATEYFNETYGSKGSDETNGNSLEKVPNVLDDAFDQELFNYFSQEFNINLLGTEIQDIIDIVKRHTSSQTEISDEEIEEASLEAPFENSFKMGAKWYREQIKIIK